MRHLFLASILATGCGTNGNSADMGMGDLTMSPAHCSNGAKDSDESDVDCGGSCAPCIDGKMCLHGADCMSGVCTNASCSSPSCSDGVKNGFETDVDCGGGLCSGCGIGMKCLMGSDCESGTCSNNSCVGAASDSGADQSTFDLSSPPDIAGCKPTLAAPVTYPVGNQTDGVALGDLNGDGRLDIAAIDYEMGNAGAVQVLLGKGDGTFAAAVAYAVGRDPRVVAIGDLNGDGKLDLAVANFGTYDVSVLLNVGNGKFGAAVSNHADTNTTGVAISDLNGDGKLDLAASNSNGLDVSVLLGNGNGTFVAPMNYPVGNDPRFVVIGDLNGDGKADLAVPNRLDNTVSVLLNKGNGTFAAAVNYKVDAQPSSVAFGDFNGDGKLDMAVTAPVGGGMAGFVDVLIGKGDGTFAASVAYAAKGEPAAVALGDLNGDGKLDIVVAEGGLGGPGDVSAFFGNGNGTFAAPVQYNAGSGAGGVALGDVNGDSRIDVVYPTGGFDSAGVLLNVCM
jgi:hypothetical protein